LPFSRAKLRASLIVRICRLLKSSPQDVLIKQGPPLDCRLNPLNQSPLGLIGQWGQALSDQPWIHGQNISFKPTPNFEFSFYRTTIFGGEGYPFTAHSLIASLELSGSVQYEKWLFPVIQPTPRTNVSSILELQIHPQKVFQPSRSEHTAE
jgi:capsule assembly protein Wzi